MNIFLQINILQILNIFFILVVIFFERKRIMNTLGWVLVLSLTSYIGFIFYIFFGLSLKKKKRLKAKENNFLFQNFLIKRNELIEKEVEIKLNKDYFDLIYYLEYNARSLYYPANKVSHYTDGKELFNAIEKSIRNAEKFIHLEYYIFRADELGTRIKNLLIQKAKEGVEIKFIYDGMGSLSVKDRFFNDLRKVGGEVECFFPPLLPAFSLRLNFRNHRKIIIVDGKEAYIGGFNVGDEYLGKNYKFGYWRDTHIKIEGDVIDSIQAEFLMDWVFVKENINITDLEVNKYFMKRGAMGDVGMQMCTGGPNYEHAFIKDSLVKMFNKAKKSIFIQSPYFIPDDTILDTLKIAALSGVEINIMIPNKPDHLFVHWATLSNCGELISLGAKVYMYNDGFLHSKTVVIDDEVATTGTANMDMRSFYVNFEINAIIYNRDFAQSLKKSFMNDVKKSTLMTKELYDKRGRIIRMKESISRLVSPVL